MAHSHLPVQHLIRQVEKRRAEKKKNDARPEWVTQFIDQVAELFEPLDDVGRVGFVCEPDDGGWIVTMYLGRCEIIGGRDDGVARPMSFHFDIRSTLACFDDVTDVRWTTCLAACEPDADAPLDADAESSCSLMTIDGTVAGQPLCLRVTSVPPDSAGPGLKRYPDGRCSPA